jgi:DNA (cytosine-5)-methyltransferase 1
VRSSDTTASAYTALDLFAGAGGLSLGLEEAGFRTVGLIESDPVASATLRENFGERPASFLGGSGDVRNISASALQNRLRRAGICQLDLLVAGPPCQGFSRVGRGKLDSINSGRGSFALDDRNNLYEEAVRFLHALRPRSFLLENVSGILHLRGRNVAEDVCDAVADAGYAVRCTLLNAAWYGVPQIRERVIIIATRTDLGIEPAFPLRRLHARRSRGHLSGAELDRRNWRHPEFFLDPRTLAAAAPMGPAVTVAEAFDDLPRFTDHLEAAKKEHRYSARRTAHEPSPYAHEPRNWYCHKMRTWNDELLSESISDHFCRWTPRDFATFAGMKPGDRYPEAVQVAEQRYRRAVGGWRTGGGRRPRRNEFIPPYPEGTFPDKWRKLIPDLPSWTITAHLGKDTYSHIHFDSAQARCITIRESARLQSFPDAFTFTGNMGDVFKQIGNAVPPLLAREIGAAICLLLARVDGRGQAAAAAWNRGWKAMLARR